MHCILCIIIFATDFDYRLFVTILLTVDKDPDVQNAIINGKGKVYNPIVTLPRSKPAHIFLYEESYCHKALNSNDNKVMKFKKTLNQGSLINLLINLPPDPSEISYIVAMWGWFKQDCRDQYLSKSGGKLA